MHARSPSAGRLLALVLLLGLAGCRPTTPATPTTLPAPTSAPPTPAPTATSVNPALERRPIGVPTIDPFPQATTTVAAGQALLWAPWPMEGRDLQRTNRSPVVGPRVGQVLWSAEIEEPSFSQVVEGADGTLFVGTENGKVQAIKPGGSVIWSFTATPPVPTPAVGPDGMVYLRGGDGALFSLRPDGRRRWTTDIGAEPKLLGPSPLIGPDSYGYLTSYHQGVVYMIQPGGFFQWAINTHARTLAGPAVGPDGTVYAGAADGILRAIDREGLERWRVDLGGPVSGPPAIGADGAVAALIGEGGAELVSVGADGRVRWRTPGCWGRGAPLMWVALAVDGRAQVGACSIGPNGDRAWSASLRASWTTPSVLDGDGQAFTAAGEAVYALGPDGTVRWRLALESVALMPPSIGSNGTLYVAGARPNRLYAIGGR